MKYLFYLIMGCSFLLSSCVSDPVEDVRVSDQFFGDVPQGTRSLADAISIAEDFFSQTSNKTRSYPRVIESVESVSSMQTRNGEESPALYLINYADNSGFALIGANKEAYDIYAISDEGRLNTTDTIGNEPLKVFLEKAIFHAAGMANAPASDAETQDQIVVGGFQYTITNQVEPMLTENVAKWHQGYPYNIYCYDPNPSYRKSVGCGAICLGQLMTFYEHSVNRHIKFTHKDFGEVTMNWKNFATADIEDPYTRQDFFELTKSLRIVGDLLGCRYTNENTWTNSDSQDFLKVMVKLGYINQNEVFLDQPLNDVLSSVKVFMKDGKNGFDPAPLIFAGVQQGHEIGHFWVVDGFVERRHRNTAPNPMYINDPILFHCVWGQSSASGFNNGYYAYITESDMIEAQEYIPKGGKGSTAPYPYYNILVIGGYKRNTLIGSSD